MKENDIVVFSETAEDEALLDKAEDALSQARAITKNIKYDDSALNIMVELGSIVDELGDEEVKKDIEYAEDAVREANNSLESAVYGLEEPFEDLVRTLRNKIDDEEMDRQDQEWEDQKRREQEQESKLVAPTAKGKKMLDHMREPLVDGDISMSNSAIDAEFINWIKEKYGDDMIPILIGDLANPKVLLKLKQEYNKETDHWAGDGGNLKYGTPRNRRSRQEESEDDQHYGYYLSQKAMKMWLKDNPGKTKRDWRYIGVDVQDEYSQKAGGKKGKYLGKGASEYTRESDDDVDYKDMRAGEFAKAHGDQWDFTTTNRAADILHNYVEPILDSFESRDEIEAYMFDSMPELGREYDSEEAIVQAFELLDLNDDMPTENTKKLKEPIRSTYRHENITSGPTKSNVRLSELSPERDNSANEEKVADLIRSALLVDHRKINPTGKDCYELFAELESINPELADLYKDVALYSYGVQIDETLEEIKRWQAIAGGAALVASLWIGDEKLSQQAYDNSPQLQELTVLHQKYKTIAAETDSIKIKNQAENYMDQLEDRIQQQEFRIDTGKGEVMGKDGRPINVIDPGAPIGNMGGADFKWPGDPNQQQEAQRPTTSSTHSTTKDIKKHDPAHGHTHPEGGNPKVCPKCKGAGCPACGDTGEVISKLRNDPKVESLKWKPGSDKKSWWDK